MLGERITTTAAKWIEDPHGSSINDMQKIFSDGKSADNILSAFCIQRLEAILWVFY